MRDEGSFSPEAVWSTATPAGGNSDLPDDFWPATGEARLLPAGGDASFLVLPDDLWGPDVEPDRRGMSLLPAPDAVVAHPTGRDRRRRVRTRHVAALAGVCALFAVAAVLRPGDGARPSPTQSATVQRELPPTTSPAAPAPAGDPVSGPLVTFDTVVPYAPTTTAPSTPPASVAAPVAVAPRATAITSPTATVSSSSAAQGQFGPFCGFAPSSSVILEVNGQPAGTETADASGCVRGTFSRAR